MADKEKYENQYSIEELEKIEDGSILFQIFQDTISTIEEKKGRPKIRKYVDSGQEDGKCLGYTIFHNCKKGKYTNVKLRKFISVLQEKSGLGAKGKVIADTDAQKTKAESLDNAEFPQTPDQNLVIKDTPFVTKFICYLWKENYLDFAILEIEPSQNKSQGAGFVILGKAKYKIYNTDGSLKFIQEGSFGKSSSFFYSITKSTTGSIVSFFSIRHKEGIFDKEKKYFDGTFTSDMRGENGSSGLMIIERKDDAETYIKQLLTKKEFPSAYIINYLYSKRIVTESNTVYESINELPSKEQINKLAKVKGIYEMFFFNTRLEGIEKAILIIEESGLIKIIQNQHSQESNGFIIASEKYLFYCHLDYLDSLKIFRRKIVFREITYHGTKYFHGILSGSARTFDKPFSSRVRIQKISNETDSNTINSIIENKESKPQVYLFNHVSFNDFIKKEGSLLKFLFGFIDGIDDGFGFFGDSLAYFNEISKKNFELKKINHVTIDKETTKLLTNTHWKVLYYDNIEQNMKVDNKELLYVFEGIAKGILSFDRDCHLKLKIGSKDSINKIDNYEGFITNQKGNILFAELIDFDSNNENQPIEKTKIIINFKIFQNEGIGIYTRFEQERIITAYVVLTKVNDYQKKREKEYVKFLKKGSEDFNAIDDLTKNFLFNHTKNAISLITSSNFRLYQSNSNKSVYKPIKVYLTSPASFVWDTDKRKDIFDEIGQDVLEIKKAIENKIANVNSKPQLNNDEISPKKVFCAFDEYKFEDLEKGKPDIYDLQEMMRRSEVLIMIFHSKLSEHIGQSSMLIEFGWASMLKIPVYIYQMKGTKLPNVIYSASQRKDSNVNIMSYKRESFFENTNDIIDHINDMKITLF